MDQHTKDMVVSYLGELQDAMDGLVKSSAVDNKTVAWLLKAWTKIIFVGTSGGAYMVEFCQEVIRDIIPAKSGYTDSKKQMARALGDFADMVGRGTLDCDPRSDYARRVENPLLNYISEYRKGLGKDSKKDKEFLHIVSDWQLLARYSLDDLRQKDAWLIFRMDQSI